MPCRTTERVISTAPSRCIGRRWSATHPTPMPGICWGNSARGAAGRISPHSTSATPWPCAPAKRDSSLTKGSRSRHWAVSPRPRPASAPRSTRSPSLRKRTTTWPTPCKPWVITRKRWPTGGRRWPCGPSTPTRGRTWPCLWSIMATRSKPPSKPARPSRWHRVSRPRI